jgi:O-antigen ligase
VELAGTLSIYPHDTFLFLAKILAYLCAFVLAAYLFDSLKGRSTLVRILILLGCFEAAYGMVQYLTGRNKIFTYTNPYGGGLATGTYINRNHFAGLLELTLPFVMGLIFYYFERWAGRRHTGAGRRGVSEEGSPGWQLIFSLFLLVVMVMGVVFSHSRGGILATAFTVLFVAGLAQLKARRKIWMVGVFLFVMCVAGYGLWIGLDPVLSRFESLRESGVAQVGGRVAIWKDAIHLVADHPLTGTGLGTFGLAFRPYQAVQVEHFIDHAHNDYVEFACDTGLPGVALLFLPIFYLLLRMIASFLDDPRRYRRAVTLGCIGSTLALLLHSISDFNLQIPANALIFAVVLGIGYKIACVERRADEQAVGPVVAE